MTRTSGPFLFLEYSKCPVPSNRITTCWVSPAGRLITRACSFLNDGNQRVIAKMLMVTTAGPGQTNDQAAQAVRDAVCDERKLDGPKTVPPFIVVDGITYIREAEVDLLTVGALASRVTSVEGDIASILQAFRAACPNH